MLELSENYSLTSGSVWNYYGDITYEVNDNASDDKSFEIKIKVIVKTSSKPPQSPQPGNPGDKTIPPKYLRNF